MVRVSARLLACSLFGLGILGCTPQGGGSNDGSGGSQDSSGGTKGSGGGSASGGSNGSSSGGSNGSGGKVSSGGSNGSSSGGSNGSGGSTASGGSGSGSGGKGSGGASNTGGSSASGGSNGSSSGGATATGGTSGGSCTVTPTVTMSTKIATVGTLTFTTTASMVMEAHVDFGLDTMYGMTAPVDLKEKDYKTYLLGMKFGKMYHYRVTVKDGSGKECSSADATLMTGAQPTGLTKVKVTTSGDKSKLFGGYLITGAYVQNAGAGANAYILDADGDYVWAYAPGGDVTGARMSYDGKWMWINNANVPNMKAKVVRVSMDGATVEDHSSEFTGLNHQLTILPDETVAFYAYGSNSCEDIKERSPSGTVKTLVNAKTAHGGTGACHVNTIQYSKEDDTYVFSDLDNQDLTKIDRTGKTIWILNGTGNQFTGDSWKGGQHGVHVLGLEEFLVFNNNSLMAAGGGGTVGGSGNGSIALDVKIDAKGKTSKINWMYKANPGIQNDVMGDVERLPNGNTIIGYSTQGQLHEVDASGTLLQSLSWNGSSFGYIEKRASLYGPPPK